MIPYRRHLVALVVVAQSHLATVAPAASTWTATKGETTLVFNTNLMTALGLRLTAAKAWARRGDDLVFGQGRGGALSFREGRRDLEVFDAGALPFRGELTFDIGGALIRLRRMTFRPVTGTDRLELMDAQGNSIFVLDNAHVAYQPATGRFSMLNMDVRLSAYLSRRLGRPEAEGLSIGDGYLTTSLQPAVAGTPVDNCPTNFGPSIDVSLVALNQLQQLQREVGVRVAIAPETQVKNVGTNDVPWFWAINPPGPIEPIVGQHPYVVFNFYRLLDGSFRQIGRSDVKHAFYSSNSDCGCAGAQVIFANCTDVYSTGNNGNQFYFGPREELTAHTGDWTSYGSHFDGVPVDDIRNHVSETNAFEHRLTLQESDLLVTGAQFFAEAWYLVKGDTNLFNSMGYRAVTPVLSLGSWLFGFASSLVTGPAINAWVPLDAPPEGGTNTVVDTGEGALQLAVTTTKQGGGVYRYRYALMNLNFDRQIARIAVPLSSGVGATNFAFHDADLVASNDWTLDTTDTAVAWSAPGTNALDWGTLYAFEFDASAPPVEVMADLGVLEPGAPTNLLVATRGPSVPVTGVGVGTNGLAQVTWSAASGAVYQLQGAPGLRPPQWTNLADAVTAQSASLTMPDPGAAASQRYYRVILQPSP